MCRLCTHLVESGLSPPLCARHPRIIRWLLPLEGCYRLNVDAAHGHRNAATRVVFRASSGCVVGAIVFPLPITTPLLAEQQVSAISLIYFARIYTAIDVEVDSSGVVDQAHSGNLQWARILRSFLALTLYFVCSCKYGGTLSCTIDPASPMVFRMAPCSTIAGYSARQCTHGWHSTLSALILI